MRPFFQPGVEVVPVNANRAADPGSRDFPAPDHVVDGHRGKAELGGDFRHRQKSFLFRRGRLHFAPSDLDAINIGDTRP